LLVRFEQNPALDIDTLARDHRVDPSRLAEATAELRWKGFVAALPPAAGTDRHRILTAAAFDVLGQLVTARRNHLAQVLSEWAPERRDELAALVSRFSRELVPDARIR
jgi:hypothetical protein